MLEQDSLPSACLSATPSSRLGGKGQDGKKKKCAGYSLAFPGRRAHPGGGSGKAQTGRVFRGRAALLLLVPFVNTS